MTAPQQPDPAQPVSTATPKCKDCAGTGRIDPCIEGHPEITEPCEKCGGTGKATPTPETDARACEAITGLGTCVGADFASSLERRLADSDRHRNELYDANAKLSVRLAEAEERAKRAEGENAKLRERLNGLSRVGMEGYLDAVVKSDLDARDERDALRARVKELEGACDLVGSQLGASADDCLRELARAVKAEEGLAKWLAWSGGEYPDDCPGDVIAWWPDGTIKLDDGVETWNPLRALKTAAQETADLRARVKELEKLLADANRGAERNAKVNRLLADRMAGLRARLAAAESLADELRGKLARAVIERDGALALTDELAGALRLMQWMSQTHPHLWNEKAAAALARYEAHLSQKQGGI